VVCGDRMYEFFDVMMLCFFVSTNAPFIYYFWSYFFLGAALEAYSFDKWGCLSLVECVYF